eukprot:9268261-Pyramimonas_sp.AAC.1
MHTVPTYMTDSQCVLVSTICEDVQGLLPVRGHPPGYDIDTSYYVPLCSTVPDSQHDLDSDEHGKYIELCFAAD